VKVALLTGGKDPHYVRGLARELAARGLQVDLVASRDEMVPDRDAGPGRVVLYDFVGTQDAEAGAFAKIRRVVMYFLRLIAFIWRTDARLFHILWFRRFPRLERLFLTLYLKLLGKKLVFTAHNVDDRARDGVDGGLIDRASLRVLYRNCHHIFVHTRAMQHELSRRFDVPEDRVTVVPLGVNDVVPTATVPRSLAREKLGIAEGARVLLFFGNIAPYKGLEDLVTALGELLGEDRRFVVLMAGRVKDRASADYWATIERLMDALDVGRHVHTELRYIPDDEVGLFFRAADVSVLPYRRVYQSGVLGLSYAQGLPVIAADVGSMREDVVEGETGFLFTAGDPVDLAAKVRTYFASDLFNELETHGPRLAAHGAERFSWTSNADRTCVVYQGLVR
jgi:glycosyltransferase involved in cell wall biosynthesis